MTAPAPEPALDFGFELDRFQRLAIEAFDADESVLVAAPTGAGKTVIAEYAIARTIGQGRRAFYTSPIKALANQKFRNFGERFGRHNVGLLTGDVSVRGDAPIVVMTTEVLRNMLYERARGLARLHCVVLDEVHYLQDRERGPVWEEVLLNLPPDVKTVSLSATVSNLDEFTAWLESVRGPTTLVVEHERPVPLHHQLAVGERGHPQVEVVPLLHGRRLNREAARFRFEPRRRGDDRGRSRGGRGGRRDRRRGSGPRDRGGSADRDRGRGRQDRGGRGRGEGRWVPPRRTELVPQLVADGMAPVIWFIFSRAGCDEALDQCLRAGLGWTDADERDELREILDERTADIDDEAWVSLGLDRWCDAFERGIASHHAGLIPAVKEAVEVAFDRGLIRVVFATETLALGVNLPARTVVLERLIKYDGEDHKLLTPMEFTQLTGRAGRRGLDRQGHALSCWSRRVALDDLAALAASADFPLRSAFAPNYNMVANLIGRAGRDEARSFVARSFAQFQIERSGGSAQAKFAELEDAIVVADQRARCERGDLEAWQRRRLSGATADDAELGGLRPGAVIAARGGSIIVSVAHRGQGVVVRAVDAKGRRYSIRAGELPSPVASLGHVRLPTGYGPSDARVGAWAIEELGANWDLETTGVEGCPDLDEHLSALAEAARLRNKLARGRDRRRRRVGALEQRFDDVADLLHELGFADSWRLTERGTLLTAVHGEAEAVLAEALAVGTLARLDAAELASVLSCLVYERRGGDPLDFRWPGRAVRVATNALQHRAREYQRLELDRFDETLTRDLDASLCEVVHGWATGLPLDAVLPDEMTGGDFVRTMRQLIDLCRQIAQATDGAIAERASEAIICLDYGVVRSRRDLLLGERLEGVDP